MAATETRRLPWIVAGVGALFARSASAQSTFDMRLLVYKESGDRTEVVNPQMLLNQDFGERGGKLSLLLGYDTISGASPTGEYLTVDTTTSASGTTTTSGKFPQVEYSDTRKSGVASYSRRLGSHLPSVDLTYSKESDYLSKGAGIADAWTMLQGRGTFHFALAFSRDVVSPVTTGLDFDKRSDGYAAGWTWIAGERDLFDVSASLQSLSGYLDDPYKVVTVGDTTLPEHRPDSRSRHAVVVKYGHYFDVRGALKTTYRWYGDDWGVRAHTLQLDYDQHAGDRWIVSPQLRLYTQTAASFYAIRLDAPRTFLSSDYRLSPFQSVVGGITVGYEIRDGLRATLGATYQLQRGRDRVTPVVAGAGGGGGDGEGRDDGAPEPVTTGSSIAAADLTVLTCSVGLSWRF